MSLVSSNPQTPKHIAYDVIRRFIQTNAGYGGGHLMDVQAEELTILLSDAGVLVDKDVLEVLTYVSSGRGYVGVTPYPDFAARRALGRLPHE